MASRTLIAGDGANNGGRRFGCRGWHCDRFRRLSWPGLTGSNQCRCGTGHQSNQPKTTGCGCCTVLSHDGCDVGLINANDSVRVNRYLAYLYFVPLQFMSQVIFRFQPALHVDEDLKNKASAASCGRCQHVTTLMPMNSPTSVTDDERALSMQCLKRVRRLSSLKIQFSRLGSLRPRPEILGVAALHIKPLRKKTT